MKKFKFIPFVLMAFALMVTSCTINDDYPTEASNKPIVKVHFESSETVQIEASAELPAYQLPILLTEAVDGNVLVEYTVNDEPFTNVISSGGLSFNVAIDRSEVAEYVVHIVNITGTTDSQTKMVDTDLDTVLVKIVPPAFVTFYLDWDSSFYDWDIFFVTGEQDFGGDVIALSAVDNWSTGISEEEFEVSLSIPDGVYSVYMQDYWGDAGGQTYTMDVTLPDGSVQSYADTFVSNFWFLRFEKTTDSSSGEVTLSITEY